MQYFLSSSVTESDLPIDVETKVFLLPGKQAGTLELQQKWSECCLHLISEPDVRSKDSPRRDGNKLDTFTYFLYAVMTQGVTHTYIVMAHSVHVILQMAFPIIRKHDAAQFSVSSEVESSIRGEHKQTGNIPPADLVLLHN